MELAFRYSGWARISLWHPPLHPGQKPWKNRRRVPRGKRGWGGFRCNAVTRQGRYQQFTRRRLCN